VIEFTHRILAAVVIALTATCAVAAWRRWRSEPKILRPAVAAFLLSLGQAAIGGVVVATELEQRWSVTAHFVVALALIADVVVLAANSFCAVRLPRKGDVGGSDPRFARLTAVTVAVTGALLLAGTWVRATGSGLVFTDWPVMDGRLVPALGGAATVMFAHRVLAALGLILVLWTAIRARVMPDRSRDLVILSTAALGLYAAQILVGAANVWTRLRPWAVVAHVALSVLIWGTLVALATVSRRFAAHASLRRAAEAAARGARAPVRGSISAYVALTKPRIIALLLITTVPAMVLAGRELPPAGLVLATLLGGTLAAASANAINMYLDRDIDEVMRRTRARPIPAHLLPPERALAFGYVLGAVSFLFLAWAVNVLAAALSLAAIVFYVFVYTIWLKRTTAQNIVIGGAAGAVPALVGWAAVTGTVGLPAWVLFAIVFVWTPPHFWALAMRFTSDYAAAGVPMLPVVQGETETRRRILRYSLALVATTLLLYPVGRMGPVYLAAAIALGGGFVWLAVELRRRATADGAWRLFRYSVVYLAALFGSVAADALL
jgi:protoheme IX farnesyltransferase